MRASYWEASWEDVRFTALRNLWHGRRIIGAENYYWERVWLALAEKGLSK